MFAFNNSSSLIIYQHHVSSKLVSPYTDFFTIFLREWNVRKTSLYFNSKCLYVCYRHRFPPKKIANVEQKALKTLQQLMVSICRYLWSVDVLSKWKILTCGWTQAEPLILHHVKRINLPLTTYHKSSTHEDVAVLGSFWMNSMRSMARTNKRLFIILLCSVTRYKQEILCFLDCNKRQDNVCNNYEEIYYVIAVYIHVDVRGVLWIRD